MRCGRVCDMKHYLYISLVSCSSIGFRRTYHLIPCSCLADVVAILKKNQTQIIDANILYDDEILLWQSEPSCKGAELILSENLLLSSGQTGVCNFCEKPSDENQFSSESDRLYLARCIYKFLSRPTSAICDTTIEVVSLIRAFSMREVLLRIKKTAFTICNMNYFDVDFVEDGITKFVGIACVIPILTDELKGSHVLCAEEHHCKDTIPQPLCHKIILALIDDMKVINANRREMGLSFLPVEV